MSPPPHFVLTCFLAATLFLLHSSPTSSLSNGTRRPPRPLSVDHYAKSCPHLDQLVASVTNQLFNASPVSGPATIRLFFHDCFVEGCDGSILISRVARGKMAAEREAEENKGLRMEAFEGIRRAKALVEAKCPSVVSCADILAIAARDFVHLAGGPYYPVKKGRWDGKRSTASRVGSNIPRSNSTVDQLISLFRSKGLTVEDLVALSGAHTIGFAHCQHFAGRLYDFKGSNRPDPTIDPRLVKALKMSCPSFGGNDDVVVPFDVTTPFSFDQAYYKNLEAKMGLLGSDQALFMDQRTRPVVQAFARDEKKFFQAFAKAMDKMGSIGVKRGRRHGEIRKDCSMHV